MQYTNTSAHLLIIAHVKFIPGASEEIPSEASVNEFKRGATVKLTADVNEAISKTPAANRGEAFAAEFAKRMSTAVEVWTAKLIAGVEGSAAFRARDLVRGLAAMPTPRKTPDQITQTLTDLEPAQAMALIKMCDDGKILERWSSTEKRGALLIAIRDRAEVLAKG